MSLIREHLAPPDGAPCPLCVWTDPDVPAPDRAALAYGAGYADGCKAVMSGMAQKMCAKHDGIRDRMLVMRGLVPVRRPTIAPSAPSAESASDARATALAPSSGTTALEPPR